MVCVKVGLCLSSDGKRKEPTDAQAKLYLHIGSLELWRTVEIYLSTVIESAVESHCSTNGCNPTESRVTLNEPRKLKEAGLYEQMSEVAFAAVLSFPSHLLR
jgi:hypothetical protein